MIGGIFIALEGIDGSGTTTHARLLGKWVRSKGLEVVQTHEPTNYRIGRLLREILRDASVPPAVDALLFAADRVDHTIHRIRPALDQGKIVITDRYIESSVAYQSASGLEREWVLSLNQFALQPDLTVLLDIPAEVALRRKRKPKPKEKFEQSAFLTKVRQIFLDRAKKRGFTIVNAEQSIKEVQNQIQKLVEPLLRNFK
jgi:dTMP kinase